MNSLCMTSRGPSEQRLHADLSPVSKVRTDGASLRPKGHVTDTASLR